jgi:pimeloyl-ACP methyl ester carboxylesterase
VRGTARRWRVVGDGAPVVLVHGLAGSWRWWVRLAPLLASHYECHMLDTPRFGRGLRPADAAAWLADWADAAQLRDVRLVGHSLGGAAAAGLAAARHELVVALALLAPTGIPAPRPAAGYAAPLARSLLHTPSLVPRLALDTLRSGPETLVRGGLSALRDDVREQARRIEAPTLLVWGDRDRLVPPAVAALWEEALPAARLAVLRGVGHVPMLERPEELAKLLLEFFDEPSDRVRGAPVGSVGPGDDRDPSSG